MLDTTQDWRFENNPQVVGPPHIRFYAGAPLRTADGHNVGSLCIIDDKPRDEFPPRSRLILKEFAAVAMREMELWRDKLQLRVRDKIQNSMERFTRECLEMDASTSSNAEAAAKMDQVYSRAAQLVCSTLDLDGCFILDIGQFEMTEIETAQGKQAVFRADPYISEIQSPVLERSETYGAVNPFPVLATTPNKVPTRPLTPMEHEKLSIFLRDNQDGKIFENIAPSWIRYMFPSSLRYGMGESISTDCADISHTSVWCRSTTLCYDLRLHLQQGQTVPRGLRAAILAGYRSHHPLGGATASNGIGRQDEEYTHFFRLARATYATSWDSRRRGTAQRH